MNAIIAVEIGIPVAEALVEAQQRLADPVHHLGAEADWVSPENLRINLLWLPDMDPGAMPRLLEELRLASRTLPEARVSVRGLRFDPDASCPRRILAIIDEGADALQSVHERLAALAQGLGLRPRGAWNATLPLALLRTPTAPVDLRGILGSWEGHDFGSSVIRELAVCTLRVPESGLRADVCGRIAFGSGR